MLGDVDLDAKELTVREQRQTAWNGTQLVGPPKTDAGRRSIAIPSALVDELQYHLDTYAQPGGDVYPSQIEPLTVAPSIRESPLPVRLDARRIVSRDLVDEIDTVRKRLGDLAVPSPTSASAQPDLVVRSCVDQARGA